MKKPLIALTAGSLLLASAAYAANSSDHDKAQFGIVNMQEILQNSSKVKSMQASYQAQAKPLENKLNKESAQMQALRKNPKQSKQLAAAQAQFKTDLKSFNDLQKKQQEQMKDLLMSSIDAVRTKLHLKAIFAKVVVISYDSSEFTDVTPMVEKQLNKK